MNENDRASGRGGTGAVGGSKNLKAIVIKAEKKIVRSAYFNLRYGGHLGVYTTVA